MKKKTRTVTIEFPLDAITTVFDECDRFDSDETGGRIIGTLSNRGGVSLRVRGLIAAGPGAQRSRVSFFQDGDWQEGVFRKWEAKEPEIEHLGNWHTHHVNGLDRLSSGDIETYRKIVNHPKHNIPLFYALLVTNRTGVASGIGRYQVKHYILERGAADVFEVPPECISYVNDAILAEPRADDALQGEPMSNERVLDARVLGEMFPGFRPYQSKKLPFYWKGELPLLDGAVEAVVLENYERGVAKYSVVLRGRKDLGAAALRIGDQYPSARSALIAVERECNHLLFRSR